MLNSKGMEKNGPAIWFKVVGREENMALMQGFSPV